MDEPAARPGAGARLQVVPRRAPVQAHCDARVVLARNGGEDWSEKKRMRGRHGGVGRTGALVVSCGQEGELHGVRRRGAGAVPAPTRAAAGAGERAEAGDQEERERRRGAADSPWAPRREERRPELVGGHQPITTEVYCLCLI